MTVPVGDQIALQPLHVIWMIDCSGSMQGARLESLNFMLRDSVKPMQDAVNENRNAGPLIRIIAFSDEARWHVGPEPVGIDDFSRVFRDLQADGCSNVGKALLLVANALRIENMPERALPPVLILVTDARPTDDFDAGLKALLDQPWGRKAIRLAIAIGDDVDMEALQRFIGNPEIRPLRVDEAHQLWRYVKWRPGRAPLLPVRDNAQCADIVDSLKSYAGSTCAGEHTHERRMHEHY